MQQNEGHHISVDQRIRGVVDGHLKKVKFILDDEQERCFQAIKSIDSIGKRRSRSTASGLDPVNPTHLSQGATEKQKHDKETSTGNHECGTDMYFAHWNIYIYIYIEENKI